MASDPYGAIKFGEFRKYMQHKKAKLKDQEMELDDKSVPDHNRIFEGLSIYINGYTDPPQSQLRKLIIQHGGDYQHYLVKSNVTHIIASNLTNSKMQEFRAYKVVKPSWITDSIKAGKLLPWAQYRTVAVSSGQKELPFSAAPVPSGSTSVNAAASSSSFSKVSSDLPRTARSPSKRSFEDMQKEDAESIRRVSTPTPSPSPPASPKLHSPGKSRHVSPSATSPHRLRGEDLNAALLAKKWNRETTTLNPDFIKKYYKSSRLHHLSTWKAEMREIVRKMEQKYPEVSDPVASRKRKRTDGVRVIMHVDFDCFFASVGLLDRPELKDKPVAVSHSKGIKEGSSSDIASCNYIARSYGISNGMQIGYAKRKCPKLQVIPYEFEKYKAVSEIFYEILFRYADQIQAVSVDEALIEVASHITQLNSGQEEALAKKIRDEIRDKTKCEASIGIGPNILLARLATRKAKPCGQYHCTADNIDELLETTDVADLPGVGYSMSSKLGEMGISKVGKLRRLKLYELQQKFGDKTGSMLYNYARGIDNRPLVMDQPRQSVSAEVNWGVRFENDAQLENFVKGLAEEVSDRLKKVEKKGKNITVKVLRRKLDAGEAEKLLGCGICDSFSKSVNLDNYTDEARVVFQHTYHMLKSFGFEVADLRGIGIQIQKLNTDADASPRHTQQTLQFHSTGTPVRKLPTTQEHPQKPQCEETRAPKIKPPMTVDAAVFAELPPEVRKEVLDGYDVTFVGVEKHETDAQGKDKEEDDGKDIPIQEQPGRQLDQAFAKETEAKPSQPLEHASAHNDAQLVSQTDMPPWSQLDPSALLALPEAMRNQLLEAYSKERERTASPAPDDERPVSEPALQPPRPQRAARTSTSPSPRNSKSRTKRFTTSSKSGFTLTQMFPPSKPDGINDGRGNDSSRQDTVREGGTALPATQSWDPNIWSELPPEMQRELLEDYRREKEKKARTIRNEHFRQAWSKLMDTNTRLLNIKTFQDLDPKLMGHSSTEEIRDMFRQWVSAFPEGPEPEDMETVSDFIMDLARIKNLEKAQMVVLSLEQIAKRDTTQLPWRQFAENLREKLCSIVENLYQLRLRF